MKNRRILFLLGLLLMVAGFVNAEGNIGDPCNIPSDCKGFLACHNGVCGEFCYDHTDCTSGNDHMHQKSGLKPAAMCGPDYRCVWAISSTGVMCNRASVCPRCDCTPIVCDDPTPIFIDLDGNMYCSDHMLVYVCDNRYIGNGKIFIVKEDAYICTSSKWVRACANGESWNFEKYPNGYQETSYSIPPDACIPEAVVAPEFPVSGAFVLFILVPAFAYLVLRTRRN